VATVDDIINNAIQIAEEQKEAASAAAGDAINASQGFSFVTVSPLGFAPLAIEPPIPEVNEANVTQNYEANLEKLVALLSQQLAVFFQNYYPLANDAFDEATAWLVNTITNGGTGIPAAIEAQIYQRARDRTAVEGLKAIRAANADAAALGHPLPPGALNASIQEIRLNQLGANASVSRDLAINQVAIEIENIRFAITTAIESRKSAMQAAGDYIRAIASAPNDASRVVDLVANARARMISATSDLYRARLSRDELVLRSQLSDQELKLRGGIGNMNGFYQGIDARVRAAIGAADVYGQAAGAALSSLISVASKAQIEQI
jgi:hypothetical protein